MNIDDLNKPALILDKDTLLHNIRTMAKKAHRDGVNLHPHVKTHKCRGSNHIIKMGTRL